VYQPDFEQKQQLSFQSVIDSHFMSFFVWQFIGFLVDQLARHRFLQVACHLERKTTNGAYELLRLVEAELQAYTSNTLGRIVCLLSLSMAMCFLPRNLFQAFACASRYRQSQVKSETRM